MGEITLQYPAWFIGLCLLLGAAYAGTLYFREHTFREKAGWLNPLLAALRFLAVSLLAFLLLEPLVQRRETSTQEPIVIYAQDASESVAAEMEAEQRKAYQQGVQDWLDDLKAEKEVAYYAFGESVRPGPADTFSDKKTDISALLDELYSRYSNQNLGAVVLATDGLYNMGSNPLYAVEKLGVPVFTVALGDTLPKRDVVLKRVFHNRIAYLGDRFTVQLDVAAKACAGNAVNLNVFQVEDGDSRLLEQRQIQIDRNDFFRTEEVELEAKQSGVQRYRVALSPVSGEVSTANNRKDFFIDVLDARQQVLLMALAPHPDVTALRQALLRNKNYEVTVSYAEDFNGTFRDVDFAVLHQLPSAESPNSAAIFDALQRENIPRLLIVGTQTDITALNRVQDLVRIQLSGTEPNAVQARVAPGFTFFTLSEGLKGMLPSFTPVSVPFGEYSIRPSAQAVLYQRIGKVDTRYPLLVLGEKDGIRSGVFCGEGLWRWRLFDYLQNDSHELFEELVGKTVQYVSLKEDKRRFRVSPLKAIFQENETVYFNAELYNENYELINEPDVTLSLVQDNGDEFSYTFDKKDRAYILNAGTLPVGAYRYRAATTHSGQSFTAEGQFSIEPIQLELYETVADHQLLQLLNDRSGGQRFYPGQWDALREQINALPSLKPVLYENLRNLPLINLRWVFFILLVLLSVEWFLRRYFGGY
jgi:hypothetical protein